MTPEQRAKQRIELEKHDPETVRLRLIESGASKTKPVPGFDSLPTAADVEAWLGEKHKEEVARQRWTLLWAIIAGITGIVSIAIAIWK